MEAKRVMNKDAVLAIDIGGSGLKAALLASSGKIIGERLRVDTPYPCPPDVMIDSLRALCAPLTGFSRLSIGFPGVVRGDTVLTAPHFDDERWVHFPLAHALSEAFGGVPAKLVNDAEMQGLAVVRGQGVELVLTLGTGAGTALFRDGDLMPHLELAHHPIAGKKSYNDYIGDVARRKLGRKKWQKHVMRTLEILDGLLHADHVYIGGGNAERLEQPLPAHVSLVSNNAGLEGGAKLWQRDFASPTRKK